MQSDRRRFLAASATGLFGFEQFLELAMAQTGTDAPKFAPGVVDFWADAMGISPDSLPAGRQVKGQAPRLSITPASLFSFNTTRMKRR